ncbi:MAG: adenylate/guanylate cyclase domain-containing protein [Spirochaetales bacterium]|nr:adenylate/guanylate cyclase domain-containing protein [Spirochaetales bacterium]
MNKRAVIARIFDTIAAGAFIAWFFMPIAPGPVDRSTAGLLLKPFTLPLVMQELGTAMFSPHIYWIVYFVPLVGLYRIVSLFFLKKLGRLAAPGGILLSLARIIATIIAMAATIFPAILFADNPMWFLAIPRDAFISIGVIFAIHVVSLKALATLINNQNAVYREYRQFKSEQNLNLPALKQASGEKKRKAANALEVLFRIRTKLFFAFIGIISIILLVLSTLLLKSYRVTILNAVGDAARGQVLQASANYRINLGDNIAMFEYLNRQRELNAHAEFAYETLTLYTLLNQEIYLDALTKELPDFRAEYASRNPGEQFPTVEPLSGARAKELALAYQAQQNVLVERNEAERTMSYISPIIKIDTVRKGDERVRRERLLGYSVMVFSEDVIFKPFFKTRVLVIVITALFLYVAVILTYLVGNYIVNPLLFLRMNVRKISNVLTTMIRGTARVSSANLVYNDCVTSRDELKSLSTEINDMVTVIRGIVPYISASTLKQAESGKASTARKELCFLFTDIRGFTTLCEGMQPEEVVHVLNSYLDLETEIILNNHGDVDKFVGDEMMAFFEGPLKEVNACRAAMQIRAAMMAEKERREKEGKPIVAIGIGINSGDVVFGSVGARDRMDFTSIGDTVNLAARLEGANKAYGSKSIITEAVYERVQDNFLCRELDFIAVKGKTEPVRIYEILQEIPQAIPKLVEIKTLFEKGLKYYRSGSWDRAISAFTKNAELYEDAPSMVFIERIQHFKKDPPPKGWDGVFRMTVK